ncbi:MAG: hypothetical protein LBK13_09065 [Spirochaetales bacterium]|jgi:hypothetical protein|nr:hypothetical protein [Spirochaetales bacterium]
MKRKAVYHFAGLWLVVLLSGCATKAATNKWDTSLDFEKQAKLLISSNLSVTHVDAQNAKTGFWDAGGGGLGMWYKVLVLKPGNHNIMFRYSGQHVLSHDISIVYTFASGRLYKLTYQRISDLDMGIIIDQTNDPPPLWEEILAYLRK